MAMTRNDFELLANALKSERAGMAENSAHAAFHINETNMARREGFRAAVNVVAGVCAASNARFNRNLFFKACGVQL